MEERPNFNFSRFMLQKPGKGLLVRNVIYFLALIALIAVFCRMLIGNTAKPVTQKPLPQEITHVKIELDTV